MNESRLRQLLEQVKEGRVELDQAVEQLRHMPFKDLGFAKLDTHRDLRCGFPEVIFCQGKMAEQVAEIFSALDSGG